MRILNIVADLAIFAGYVLVPFTWLRRLPLTRSVRAAALMFFLSAALTRLAILTGRVDAWYMSIVHVTQAVGVMWFVLGFWRLLMRAAEIRRMAHAHLHAQHLATDTTRTADIRDEEPR